MLIAGGIGFGLVSGWLAARLVDRARWTVIVRVLLGVITQGIVVLRLTSLPIMLWFAGALLLGALLCTLWLRTLQARYGAAG